MGLSVLGPLRLDGPAGPVPVSGRKMRQTLALPALAAPRPLSVDALATRLWDEPPPSAVKTVQAHVSRARSALAASGRAGTLRGGTVGYHLEAGPAGLDVLAVEDLRRRARLAALAADDRTAAELLQRARRLWRGEPECPGTALGEAERAAALVHEAMRTGDVRAVLPRVRAPVLVVSRLRCPSHDPGHGRYLAGHLPDAVLVEYPDPNGPWYLGDTARVLAEFAQFIRGT